tara:strand:- start:207 stop:404 length:198 start_codon:yes stop_codon:yes gene_type:complete
MKQKKSLTKRDIIKSQSVLYELLNNLALRVSTVESTFGKFLDMEAKKEELLEFIKSERSDGDSDE